MSMNDWAEKEAEIRIKQEGGKDSYGGMCVESALKAYKSLCLDGHSGCSIGFTKMFLDRLIDGLPLTPITDKDFDGVVPDTYTGDKCYQCPRDSSLFKYVDKDGNVSYSDVNRSVFYDAREANACAWNGPSKLIDKLFPIKLPYMPSSKLYKVYGETFLFDKDGKDITSLPTSRGTFNVTKYYYLITPDGERIEINETRDERQTPKN